MAVKKIKRTRPTSEPMVIEEEIVTEISVDRPRVEDGVISKKRLYLAILLLLFGLVWFWYRTNSWPIAAMVNGSPVTRFALDQELYKQGGQQVLDNLITEKLVHSELEKSKITVSDDEVTARIDEIKTSLGESFDAALAAQGVTMDQLKSQILTQVKLEKLLSPQASVSAEEIDQAVKDGNPDRAAAEKIIRQQKVQELISTWVQDIKTKAKITIIGAPKTTPETSK